MDPTTLNYLIKEGGVTCHPDGLIIEVRPAWVVHGEDRLSYTTLVRLVECCREHHWNKDILPVSGRASIDSTTKSLSGVFVSSVPIGSEISVTYEVTNVRHRGYMLKFEVRNAVTYTLHASFEIVSVFYDSVKRKAVPPPESVARLLARMASKAEQDSE